MAFLIKRVDEKLLSVKEKILNLHRFSLPAGFMSGHRGNADYKQLKSTQ